MEKGSLPRTECSYTGLNFSNGRPLCPSSENIECFFICWFPQRLLIFLRGGWGVYICGIWCIWFYMCAGTHTYVCMYMWWPKVDMVCLPQLQSYFSIRQGLPENLELTDLARTTGQQAPAITLSASLALTPILALPVCATAPSFSYGC